jgi:hypothetical protein
MGNGQILGWFGVPGDSPVPCSFGKEMTMKTIQSQSQNDDLRDVVERIVQDLENSHAYRGKLLIARVEPPPNASPDTPAGYPHLMVEEQEQTKLLGLIPYDRKRVILLVKEGFYDIEEKGRKDAFVFLKSKSCEAVVREHFGAYRARHQATEVVYKS